MEQMVVVKLDKLLVVFTGGCVLDFQQKMDHKVHAAIVFPRQYNFIMITGLRNNVA